MSSTEIPCPKCRRGKVYRIHRSFVEKLLARKKKYRCMICRTVFFEDSKMAGQHVHFGRSVSQLVKSAGSGFANLLKP